MPDRRGIGGPAQHLPVLGKGDEYMIFEIAETSSGVHTSCCPWLYLTKIVLLL